MKYMMGVYVVEPAMQEYAPAARECAYAGLN
jgi:hypothetical protein